MAIALFLIGAIIFICGAGIGIVARDWNDGARSVRVVIVGMLIMFLVLLFAPLPAASRDGGRFTGSPLKPWFDGLRSGKGPCCSDADGYVVEDADWEATKDGHYKVRIPDRGTPGDPMIWVDVPEEAVITEPNRAGRTMVWPIYGYLGASIRCFMPGVMI